MNSKESVDLDSSEMTAKDTPDTEEPKAISIPSPPRRGRPKAAESLRIAMIGQKGLPATYGGIEHHVEDLSERLAGMGHEITVFCRRYYSGELDNRLDILKNLDGNYIYKGIKLRLSGSIRTKHLDAITHSANSTMLADKRNFDIVHFHGIGQSFMSFIPALRGQKCVATIHALDYRQKKWGWFARICLRIGLRSALRFADKTICVSNTMRESLKNPPNSVYIPNGVKETLSWGPEELGWLDENGLSSNGYILFVGRLIEDKGCHLLCRAVNELGLDLKLAVAGSSSFTDDYVENLKKTAGPETVFLGNVYGRRLSALYQNCTLFVLPSAVEGLPIVMLEAMKHGAPVLVSDIPENLEILNRDKTSGEIGISFENGNVESLKSNILFALSNPEFLRRIASDAQDHVDVQYNMDRIAEMTNEVYQGLLR